MVEPINHALMSGNHLRWSPDSFVAFLVAFVLFSFCFLFLVLVCLDLVTNKSCRILGMVVTYSNVPSMTS
ncbi:hypothetical protein SLEP1_g60276 [Rubroshorea leprosula]|uniref:Uncharacterized protein n=1 Tax=Rubroshorea leprosula TaxID=152421 RepID=A0AAV5MYK1_9ROSI|nr:hypothetical protein SLEP1_g60276 [Rubroshorea leprosula]